MANDARADSQQKATIVLVHGAFADSWNRVIDLLAKRGYPVVSAANPLRGLKSDASEVSAVIDAIQGPVVLVGHSYGGAVVSNTASAPGKLQALGTWARLRPTPESPPSTWPESSPGPRWVRRWHHPSRPPAAL